MWPTDGGIDGGLDPDGGTDGGGDAGTDASVDAGPPPPSVGLLASGYQHSRAAPPPPDLRCWGTRAPAMSWMATTPEPVSGLPGDVEMVVSGADHSCAAVGGSLLCGGDNREGQLGRAPPGYEGTPEVVADIEPLAVAAGQVHTCALTTAGEVLCWGANDRGQLGDGTTVARSSPAAVSIEGTVVDITARGSHTCALLSEGSIRCRGRNHRGPLGNGTTSRSPVPVPVALIDDAVQIEAGSAHSCALRSSGELRCWGDNRFGQLAMPIRTTMSTTPVAISGLGGRVAEVEAGVAHLCARLTSATVECSGDNQHGQTGQAAPPYEQTTPTVVPGLSGLVDISGGDDRTCARLDTYSIGCWGCNDAAQLGDTDGDRETPGMGPWP